jgi:hypothetical protein
VIAPEKPFYLFGMGDRTKLVYKDGKLFESFTGHIVRQWNVTDEMIDPIEYRVLLTIGTGVNVVIYEDENGVYIQEGDTCYPVTESRIQLPEFRGHPYSKILKVLHQEILINIYNGLPVPNYFVYKKPWYRDAAMMGMCLQETGNLHVIEDWIMNLKDPFDRNNAGHCEPDNLGQVLYLVSLVSNESHPIVQTILETLPHYQKGDYIVGTTDFAERPVYQTKWLKFGLQKLGLVDRYEIPVIADEYSDSFWMDYTTEHVPVSESSGELNADNWFTEAQSHPYPYLIWAKANFYGWPLPGSTQATLIGYPVTWEKDASQANYPDIGVISKRYVQEKFAAPHTWHAAEMFLYLLKQRG